MMNQRFLNTTTDKLLQQYPIRNEIWMAHDDGFSAEDSTLSANDARTDPWNRPLPDYSFSFRNSDNDITHWTFVTTVAGHDVHLTIWND